MNRTSKIIILSIMFSLMSICAIAQNRISTFPDGTTYVGQVRAGRAHGFGTYTFPDGSKYVGQFWEGRMHGNGTYLWPSGSKYEGQFKDGYKHGNGTFTWADGSIYTGQWWFDKAYGQGTMTWDDGRRYVGGWRNDKMHGQGTKTWPDGKSFTGLWENGEKVTKKRHFLYITGGWGDVEYYNPYIDEYGAIYTAGTFVLGIGYDYLFTNKFSLFAEFLYYGLNTEFGWFDTKTLSSPISIISVPVGIRYNFLKYCFAGGGAYYSFINYKSTNYGNYDHYDLGIFMELGLKFDLFTYNRLLLYIRSNGSLRVLYGETFAVTLNAAYGIRF